MADLNDKQRRFAEEYLVDLNATQAAIRAGYSAKTAHSSGPRLLEHVGVAAEIARLKDERSQRTGITREAVLQHLWEIATADPNELVQYRRGACPACWMPAGGIGFVQTAEEREAQPHGGALKRTRRQDPPVLDREPNPDCEACGGEGFGRVYAADTRNLSGAARRLYAGARQTRDGFEIKMRSQDGALSLLFDHLGLSAPKRQEHTGAGGGPIEHRPLTDELAALPQAKRDAIRAAIKRAMEDEG
ncbi:MAG: terminase small subunit [Pseudomonadota bacterium]